jgi:hypothetical protein
VRDQPLYRFSSPRFVPFTIFGHIAALFSFVALAVWALQHMGEAGDIWFWLLFLAFAVVLTWVDLFKIAFEMRIEDQVLKWRCPLRSGDLRCDQILTIRNVLGSWPWPLVRIRPSDGPSVYVYAKRSVRDFVDGLLAENRGIEVDARSYRSWKAPG